MTTNVDSADARVAVKLRRPVMVGALSVITLGLYSVVWYYKVTREMRDYGASRGDARLASVKPRYAVLAITLGSVIVVPKLVSFVRAAGRVQAVERVATGSPGSRVGLTTAFIAATLLPFGGSARGIGWIFTLAALAALFAAVSEMQARLNAVWTQIGASRPAD
jgi:hypothetical protein